MANLDRTSATDVRRAKCGSVRTAELAVTAKGKCHNPRRPGFELYPGFECYEVSRGGFRSTDCQSNDVLGTQFEFTLQLLGFGREADGDFFKAMRGCPIRTIACQSRAGLSMFAQELYGISVHRQRIACIHLRRYPPKLGVNAPPRGTRTGWMSKKKPSMRDRKGARGAENRHLEDDWVPYPAIKPRPRLSSKAGFFHPSGSGTPQNSSGVCATVALLPGF